MSVIELAPSMFQDHDSYEEAVRFHHERAATRPGLRVVTYTNAEYQRKIRREENAIGDEGSLS